MQQEQIIKPIIIFIIGALGIIINLAILVVYIRLSKKVTSPSVTDQIIFTMGVTGLLLQCSLLSNGYLVLLCTEMEINPNCFLVVFYVLFVTYNMSFWNTAWLSVSYCVKLVNVSHRIALKFKAFLSSSIRTFLIRSALISVGVNLPLFWTANVTILHNTNISDELTCFKMEVNVYYTVFKMLEYALPFTLSLISIGLSVRSLLQHVWRVHQNLSQSSSSPKLQALLRAAVTMTLRVLLDLTFLVIITYATVMSFSVNLAALVIIISFLLCYPLIQSVVLIFGNPKLKKSLFGEKVKKSVKG